MTEQSQRPILQEGFTINVPIEADVPRELFERLVDQHTGGEKLTRTNMDEVRNALDNQLLDQMSLQTRYFIDGEILSNVLAEEARSNRKADRTRQAILEALSSNPGMGWSDLIETSPTGDEDVIEDVLLELQADGNVSMNPRKGGYFLIE